ncbi:putative nuclease HARBI1 [Cololabis saira]|uniref:putative nuclease HARBI1 n=1 Tax=Cololabis saira TaxID=129043 RepID=UPI002AD38CA9|nr:putative nuclease HARBI1 [Cololabis saira]XP_061589440.1 putative nuclease HARBI1 [Cololabis saira]
MAFPFDEGRIIDREAQIVRAIHRERVIRPRYDILSFPDEHLRERYRFSAESLLYLNNLLHPYIENVTHRGSALSSLQTMCIALRFFASGSFLYSVGDAEHIGKATACRSVRKVCLALKRFMHRFIRFPGHKPTRVIKTEFHQLAGFPNIIGCIDGTHVPIKAPSQNEADFVNRKGFHSINVQMICDAGNLISNVEARWPGSVHDARMYRESNLSTKFLQREFDGYLLGDRGYPCLPTLITPYPDPDVGAQTQFNVAHSRTRVKIEMTFGILKERFQCLRRLRVCPDRACDIIVACAILHNFATLRNEFTPVVEEPVPEEPLQQQADMADGHRVRDQICLNHFS